jgi:hypothetical protein
MSDKLEKKNKRRERKLSQAIDAGREFRKAIRGLTSVGFDESYIEGFEARLTFDIRVLKKERDRLHGDDVTEPPAEASASPEAVTRETATSGAPEVAPPPPSVTAPAAATGDAKPAGPKRTSRPRRIAGAAKSPEQAS